VLTNQADKNAWPLSGATFILMHKSQDKPAQGAASLKFFEWAYQNGDKTAADMEFVALPAAVKDLVRKQWASIADASGKAIAYK
jgi:phosphate transport system substrate-binding protein